MSSDSAPLLTDILRDVSRSFYLTLRVLPASVREPIGLAYLLARGADTLADTMIVSPEKRLQLLQAYDEQLYKQALGSVCDEIKQNFNDKENNLGEQRLLTFLPQIFALLNQQQQADRQRIQQVVSTLISGMVFDLNTFPNEESGALKALEKEKELDRYTYLVAGCVGEFWTQTSLAHVPELKHWQNSAMSDVGVRFGKALQLTNILRDLPRDLRIGRCYLPQAVLSQYGLTAEMLLDKANNEKARTCLLHFIAIAHAHYEAAEQYVIAIPRRCVRLRLAALWPMLIGLSTLNELVRQADFLNENTVCKVKRKWVYAMIFKSCWVVFSNKRIQRWTQRLGL